MTSMAMVMAAARMVTMAMLSALVWAVEASASWKPSLVACSATRRFISPRLAAPAAQVSPAPSSDPSGSLAGSKATDSKSFFHCPPCSGWPPLAATYSRTVSPGLAPRSGQPLKRWKKASRPLVSSLTATLPSPKSFLSSPYIALRSSSLRLR